jgi:hypothetical protein
VLSLCSVHDSASGDGVLSPLSDLIQTSSTLEGNSQFHQASGYMYFESGVSYKHANVTLMLVSCLHAL